jgi:hypothetical protein
VLLPSIDSNVAADDEVYRPMTASITKPLISKMKEAHQKQLIIVRIYLALGLC